MRPQLALSLTLLSLLTAPSAFAMKFQILGHKATAMGGASVANSTSSLAAYNNPALLARPKHTVEISVGAGIGVVDYGVLDVVQKLDENGYGDLVTKASEDVSSLSEEEVRALADGTKNIIEMDGKAVGLEPQTYLGAQVSHYGVGVFETSDAIALATVDQEHDQLYFKNGSNYYDTNAQSVSQQDYEERSIEYAMNNDLTYLEAKGIALVEVPIAYGHQFRTPIGHLMVGGAFKYMQAITYEEQLNITNIGSTSDGSTKEKTTKAFGVDLGLAYVPSFSRKFTLGLVAKNLNSPSFKFYDGDKYTVSPLVRTGLAYKPFESLEFAADLDLTSNGYLYRNVKSQMLGGGVSYEPLSSLFSLSLRAGAMKNIHPSDNTGVIYTAGMGAGFKWIEIDLSAEAANKMNKIQDVSIPSYTKVNLALISRW